MHRLSPSRTVSDALATLDINGPSLVHALLIPSVALALLRVVEPEPAIVGWSAWGAYFACRSMAYAVFAVTCHRVLLLGDQSLPNRWGLYFTGRELRFWAWSLIVAALSALPLIGVAVFVDALNLVLPGRRLAMDRLDDVVALLAAFPAWYVMSRASLVLPAVAIDQRPPFLKTWRLSRGNGARLSVVTAVPFVVVVLLRALLGSIVSPDGLFSSWVVSLLTCLAAASEVGVLSVSFRRLGGTVTEVAAA